MQAPLSSPSATPPHHHRAVVTGRMSHIHGTWDNYEKERESLKRGILLKQLPIRLKILTHSQPSSAYLMPSGMVLPPSHWHPQPSLHPKFLALT